MWTSCKVNLVLFPSTREVYSPCLSTWMDVSLCFTQKHIELMHIVFKATSQKTSSILQAHMLLASSHHAVMKPKQWESLHGDTTGRHSTCQHTEVLALGQNKDIPRRFQSWEQIPLLLPSKFIQTSSFSTTSSSSIVMNSWRLPVLLT